jgi:hypothetical protein
MGVLLPNAISRRAMLRRTGLGFAALGLEGLLAQAQAASETTNPLAPKQPHYAPRAKRVIFLFMHGGVSQVDSFDPKPRLQADAGKPMPIKRELSFSEKAGGLMASPFEFKQYGQSGIPVSSLFPHMASRVDDLCVVRSMVGDAVDHGGAMLQLHTGSFTFVRPSMGSWALYGLGSENQNLPGFVTIKPTLWHGGGKNWGSAFLPGAYQGTPIGYSAMEVDNIKNEPIEHLTNKYMTTEQQRLELEMVQKLNRWHAEDKKHDAVLEARIQALELAFRMQGDGRDHNPYGFTIWLAGGGVQGGMVYGATDEFGYHAVENRIHIHDLHATILHLLGLNHEQLYLSPRRPRFSSDRRSWACRHGSSRLTF